MIIEPLLLSVWGLFQSLYRPFTLRDGVDATPMQNAMCNDTVLYDGPKASSNRDVPIIRESDVRLTRALGDDSFQAWIRAPDLSPLLNASGEVLIDMVRMRHSSPGSRR